MRKCSLSGDSVPGRAPFHPPFRHRPPLDTLPAPFERWDGLEGRAAPRELPMKRAAPIFLPLLRRDRVRRIAWALLLASPAGCRSSAEDIEGRDNRVFWPDFRAAWYFRGEGLEPAGEGETETGPRRSPRHVALELDLSQGNAETDQQIDAGDEIRLGNATIVGPARVKADSDLFAGSLAFRGGARVAPDVVLEGLAGLAWYRLDLEVSSGGISDSERFDSIGPLLGAQVTYEPLDRIALHARGTVVGGVGPDAAEATNGEAGVAFRFTRGARIFGGWRWRNLKIEGKGSDSDVRLELSGPTVGLEVRF
jgi:hypothetical protein